MKKILLCAGCLLIALTGITSCGGKDNKVEAPAPSKNQSTTKESTYSGGPLPIAYVDRDTIMTQYNLAIDLTEQMEKKRSALEQEENNQSNLLQKQQETMQKKMQNNQYTSEEQFKADQAHLMNLQKTAETKIYNLQNEIQKMMVDSQTVLMDSVENFIQEYNKKKGYAAILYKDATIFIDPSLDITDEVVEGLNARYNKVSK